MKSLIIRLETSFFVFFFGLNKVFAQTQGTQTQGGTQGVQTQPDSSVVPDAVNLVNPITVDSVPALIERILEIVLTIGIPIVALAIIYSGYKFIAAQGNPQKLQDAKQTFTYVIIGSLILLAAWVIARAIAGTVCTIIGSC